MILLISLSTYAVLFTKKSSNNKNLYKTGNLDVVFDSNSKTNINIENSLPTSDDIGSKTKPYEFSIKAGKNSNNDYKTNYSIRIVPNSKTTISLDKIKIKINDDKPVLLSSFKDNIISFGVLNQKDSKYFKIRLWIDINAGIEVENQLFSANIVVTSQAIRNE